MPEQFSRLKQCVLVMGNKTLLAVDTSITAMTSNNTATASEVRNVEKLVDSMYHSINEQCLELLASKQRSRGEVNYVVNSLKIAMELERICDYANQIAKLVQKSSPNRMFKF